MYHLIIPLAQGLSGGKKMIYKSSNKPLVFYSIKSAKHYIHNTLLIDTECLFSMGIKIENFYGSK